MRLWQQVFVSRDDVLREMEVLEVQSTEPPEDEIAVGFRVHVSGCTVHTTCTVLATVRSTRRGCTVYTQIHTDTWGNSNDTFLRETSPRAEN